MNRFNLLFMNRICLLLLFPFLLSACQEKTKIEPEWSVEEKRDLPFPVSNQAVVEGFIEDEPYVYSFGGLDSTKSYAGIHLRSFRYDVKRDEWKEILALPDTLGKIAVSFGTTVQSLINLNEMANENVIFVGQKIKIPG